MIDQYKTELFFLTVHILHGATLTDSSSNASI